MLRLFAHRCAVVVAVVIVIAVVVTMVVVVGSHPLHVLSHSPPALSHNPSDKMVWHCANGNALRLLAHRCVVVVLTGVGEVAVVVTTIFAASQHVRLQSSQPKS